MKPQGERSSLAPIIIYYLLLDWAASSIVAVASSSSSSGGGISHETFARNYDVINDYLEKKYPEYELSQHNDKNLALAKEWLQDLRGGPKRQQHPVGLIEALEVFTKLSDILDMIKNKDKSRCNHRLSFATLERNDAYLANPTRLTNGNYILTRLDTIIGSLANEFAYLCRGLLANPPSCRHSYMRNMFAVIDVTLGGEEDGFRDFDDYMDRADELLDRLIDVQPFGALTDALRGLTILRAPWLNKCTEANLYSVFQITLVFETDLRPFEGRMRQVDKVIWHHVAKFKNLCSSPKGPLKEMFF